MVDFKRATGSRKDFAQYMLAPVIDSDSNPFFLPLIEDLAARNITTRLDFLKDLSNEIDKQIALMKQTPQYTHIFENPESRKRMEIGVHTMKTRIKNFAEEIESFCEKNIPVFSPPMFDKLLEGMVGLKNLSFALSPVNYYAAWARSEIDEIRVVLYNLIERNAEIARTN